MNSRGCNPRWTGRKCPSALEGPNSLATRRSSTLPGSDPRLHKPTVGCTHGYSHSSPAGLLACPKTCSAVS